MQSINLAMRLALAALLCAGLTAGLTCPYPTVTNVYEQLNACAPWNVCIGAYCTCVGTTLNTATGWCNSHSASCGTTQNCSKVLIPCLNNAAPQDVCNVTALAPLRLQLANLAAGAFYNGSTTEQACNRQVCALLNASVAAPDTCSQTAISADVCRTPYVYTATLSLSGDWTSILANTTAKAILTTSLETDLTAKLQVPVTVTGLAAGSLVVTFTAAVSPNNAALVANVQAAATTSTWLTSTQAAYTSNGGSGSLNVQSLTQVTTAPPTTAGPTTPPPTTPGPTPPSPPGSAAALTTFLATLVAVALLAL